MEPHMLEAQLLMAAPELRLPVGAQRDRRMIASDRVLPEMWQRAAGFGNVTEELDHVYLLSARRTVLRTTSAVNPNTRCEARA